MSPWGWQPARTEGIWRHGLLGLKPFAVAVPWITVGLLLILFSLVSDTLVTTKGALVDLPTSEMEDGETTGVVALIVPSERETLVFIDDSRYVLGDPHSHLALGEHLSATSRRMHGTKLLALVDRRVSAGDLMAFMGLARKNGVEKVLFAEQKEVRDE